MFVRDGRALRRLPSCFLCWFLLISLLLAEQTKAAKAKEKEEKSKAAKAKAVSWAVAEAAAAAKVCAGPCRAF